MERFTRLSALFALTALAMVFAPCAAQEARSLPASAAPQPIVRQTAQRPLPYSLGNGMPDSAASLEFRAESQISQQDRALWAGAQASIIERARVAGVDFNQGSWEARQIVCSALPDHLFLTFTHGSGSGDASVFTASIPRGSGQTRVIPILRRGFSLFSPAPVNALTISAFNHIRTEEHPAQPSNWLATGLCYAALAGAHPQMLLASDVNERKDSTAVPGSLTISADSGGEISFIDQNANSRRDLWTMSFDSRGKLLKVTLTQSLRSREQMMQKTSVEVQGSPVQQAAEIQGRPVPQPTEVQGKPVAASAPAASAVPVR